MCTHQKYVFNKYINKRLLVNCGKCPECQQAKANLRATRIKNHNCNSVFCLFVTLTYDNKFVPYVKTKELYVSDCEFSDSQISIYRDFDFRWYRDKSFLKANRSVIGTISKSDIKPFCYAIPQITKRKGCTSIIVWSDVQNFIKRLRIDLKRELGYKEKISYYAVGEYGGKTYRCHFHLLLYFPKGSYETLFPFLVKAWPYGDLLRENKRVQVAIDPSSYLASYLSKSADFPVVLESHAIRQKSSHSFHFGVGSVAFSLDSILAKADRGDMCYTREVINDGKPLLVSLAIPEYAISRWFPKFKGRSSFAPDEILQLLRFYNQYWNKLGCLDEYRIDYSSWFDDGTLGILGLPKYLFVRSNSRLIAPELLVSYKDFRAFVIRLSHAFGVYHEITGKNIFDYAIDYQRVWLSRWNYCFKHSFDVIKSLDDFRHFYENADSLITFNYVDVVNDYGEFSSKLVLGLSDIAPTLPPPRLDKIALSRHGIVSPDYQFDPNKRFSVIKKDMRLKYYYDLNQKKRAINAVVFSSMDDQF